MTQEEKQLLLKDLCARLPYHDLWVQYDNKDWLAFGYGHGRIELLSSVFSSVVGPCPLINEIKPYLRPMSSMTEKERRYLLEELGFDEDLENGELNDFGSYVYRSVNVLPLFDWLNEHHFDYRGLIEKCLALEAPADMYKTE